MPRWSRTPSALLSAAAVGAIVFGSLALSFLQRSGGEVHVASLGVALASGTLVGVTALMLLGSRPIGNDGNQQYGATPCAVCASPLIDEWRMCPHCGHMLQCKTGQSAGADEADSA